MDIVSRVIGGNSSSRLYTILREKNGLVYGVSTDTIYYDKMGIFYIHTTVENKNVSKVITLIMEELHNLQTNGITKQEFTEAISSSRGSLSLELSQSLNVIMYYSNELLYNMKRPDDMVDVREYFSMLSHDSLDYNNINLIISQYLSPYSMKAVMVGSFNDQSIVTTMKSFLK